MAPEEADDRRAEIRSDRWEFTRYTEEHPQSPGERLRRLVGGVADDIAWRVSFGRRALSPARSHEAVLLIGLAALLFVAIPASIWWAVALAGEPSEPGLQIWYIGTEAIALACTVVGGAASAAYYPKSGRALMLSGAVGLAVTLWWAPIVAAMVLVAAVTVILSLPKRTVGEGDLLSNSQDIL